MYNCFVNFSDLTTLKIGGPIQEVIPVETEQQLVNNIQMVVAKRLKYLVIGGGSNLLVSDKGFDGTVIKNETLGIHVLRNSIAIKSGESLQRLVDSANEQGLAGLENLAGIPGTVGGAIYGNAGAYGQAISDHLVSVKAFDPGSGTIKLCSNEECQFFYRDSVFKRNGFVILEATFSLNSSDSEQLKNTSAQTIKKREVKYPPG